MVYIIWIITMNGFYLQDSNKLNIDVISIRDCRC